MFLRWLSTKIAQTVRSVEQDGRQDYKWKKVLNNFLC